MPFTWQITINKAAGKPGFTYEPKDLTNVSVGDLIHWTNNDDRPHWPGLAGNPVYFLPNQIAPNSPSATFVPGGTGTVAYSDSLNPGDPGGTIVVS